MSNKSVKQLIAKLLEKRGILTDEQDAFLHPDFERDTHSPWLLPNIEAAVARLVKAHETQESIVIFGDYDADGIPATALLVRALKYLGFTHVRGVIPTRNQGYGLTPAVVEALLEHKPDIIVTVDNGTISKDEVALIAGSGVDVIIIDHHEPLEGKIADAALAIVNPKMAGSTYPFVELCACALSWKVAFALAEKLGKETGPLRWMLDLVGLSTIADMVPLVGENRVLAVFGLKVLGKTRNAGLQALMQVAGVDASGVTAGDVGFKLAPRINAPSRMHDEIVNGEHSALALLTTESAAEAADIAQHLNKQNAERQQLVETHLEQAHAQVLPDTTVIVAFHKDWSTGVIGLVASRLMDRYQRPVVVLAPEGDEIKGSVRSVDGVHALELLESASAELERFGGHTKAAGLTLKGSVDAFRALLETHMLSLGCTLATLAERSIRNPDGSLTPADMSLDLAEALEELEPFGIGFPKPLFTVESEVKNIRMVGSEGQHATFFLIDKDVQRKAIAFSYHGPVLEEGRPYRFYGSLVAEEWQQVKSPVMQVKRVEAIER